MSASEPEGQLQVITNTTVVENGPSFAGKSLTPSPSPPFVNLKTFAREADFPERYHAIPERSALPPRTSSLTATGTAVAASGSG